MEENKMNVITTKCECGNKVDVDILDRLSGNKYFPDPPHVRTHDALMG
jgi:hypothetical protein